MADGLRRLHVLDGDGRLRIGLQAFITIWRELARWRWLAAVAALKPAPRPRRRAPDGAKSALGILFAG